MEPVTLLPGVRSLFPPSRMSDLIANARPMTVSVAAADRPVTVIGPRRGWRELGLREVWRYRDLAGVLARREVTLRYRQTALGVLWVVLQPLLAAAIFAFVFGRVARLPSGGGPYFVFAYAGFLAWNAFQSTLLRASTSLVQNSQLISKVYFPRLVLPLATLGLTMLDFAVGAALLVIILPVYRVQPSLAIVTLPFWLGAMALLALGIGLYLAALVVRYRDVQHALPILVQFGLYASPVAYATGAIPAGLARWIRFNPLVGLLDGARWSLISGAPAPRGLDVAYSLAAIVVALGVGLVAFRRLEQEFADVV